MNCYKRFWNLFFSVIVVTGAFEHLAYADKIDDLIERLKTGSEKNREYAAEVLKNYRNPVDTRTIKPLMQALVKDAKWKVRWRAAITLGYYYMYGEYSDSLPLEALRKALKDPHEMVRKKAADNIWGAAVFKEVKDPTIIPDLVQLLSDPKKEVRMNAAKALGAYKNSRAFKPLILTLKDKEGDVRKYAAEALGVLGDINAKKDLIPLLKDPQENVRKAAKGALQKLGVDDDELNVASLNPRAAFESLVEEIKSSSYVSPDKRKSVIEMALSLKPPPNVSEEARRYMVHGKVAFKNAKGESGYKAAQEEFKKASKIAPWWPAPYFNLGLVREKLRKYNDAQESMNFYLLAAPNASDADAVKEKIYELQYLGKRQEKAEEYIKKALDLYNAGNLEGSIIMSKQAIEQDPSVAEAHGSLGLAYSAKGRHKDAIPELKESIRLGTHKAYVYIELGRSYKMLGDIKEAIRILEEGVEKIKYIYTFDNSSGFLYQKLGRYYEEDGQREKALFHFKKAYDIGGPGVEKKWLEEKIR